jgi:hypothetical protein
LSIVLMTIDNLVFFSSATAFLAYPSHFV